MRCIGVILLIIVVGCIIGYISPNNHKIIFSFGAGSNETHVFSDYTEIVPKNEINKPNATITIGKRQYVIPLKYMALVSECNITIKMDTNYFDHEVIISAVTKK